MNMKTLQSKNLNKINDVIIKLKADSQGAICFIPVTVNKNILTVELQFWPLARYCFGEILALN